MKNTIRTTLFILATTVFTQQVYASSFKELLEDAFDSPSGNLTAPIDGEMTDMIKRTLPIKGDVVAEVRTMKHFKEKDCRRFSVKLRAKLESGSGERGPAPLPTIEINYCKGGGYPQEGVDPDAVKKMAEQMDAYARERAAMKPAANPQIR